MDDRQGGPAGGRAEARDPAPEVLAGGWLAATRASYDTVAESYARMLRGLLDDSPYERACFALFAELVHAAGGGPVADVGCGPGRITAHLRRLGVEAFGIDLSPAMIDVARRDHPGIPFAVGSMTRLDLEDTSVAGLVAWYSLIHVPDDEVGRVVAQFRRVLRPGAPLLLGFHVGDDARLKTEGYGGHPMHVHVYRRPPDRIAGWLRAAGFGVAAQLTLSSPESRLGGILVAHRRP